MEKIPNRDKFMEALSEGMTFMEACEYSDNDPKSLSEFLQRNASELVACKDAVRNAAKLFLDMAADEAKKGQLYRAEKAREKAKEMQGKWMLWGGLGKMEDMTSDQILRAARRMGSARETSSALGVTEKEFDDYLEKNELHELLDKVIRKASW